MKYTPVHEFGLNLNLVFLFYDFPYVFPRHLKIVWFSMGFLRSTTMILVSELTPNYFYSVRIHAPNFLLILTTCSVSKGGFALFVFLTQGSHSLEKSLNFRGSP